MYVAAVVIVNAVDTVLAGRLPQIALLRLLGARASSLRSAAMRGVAVVGAIGAVGGAAVGTVAADVLRVVLVHQGHLEDTRYPVTSAWLVVPVLTITAASALAGRIGSRQVLAVSPAAAMGGPTSTTSGARRTSRRRLLWSTLLVVTGVLLLLLAMVLGESGSLAGFLVAFLGSVTASTGLLVGARLDHPRPGRAHQPPARPHPGSAPRRPQRGQGPPADHALDDGARDRGDPGDDVRLGADRPPAVRALLAGSQRGPGGARPELLTTITQVLVAMVVISSLISAVGFVSTMSLTVIQRRREIGLLRALGLTRRHVSRMITLESAALSATAIAFGIALGVVFGSVGTQSLVGPMTAGFAWGLPWLVLGGTVVGAGLSSWRPLVLRLAGPSGSRPSRRCAPTDVMRSEPSMAPNG